MFKILRNILVPDAPGDEGGDRFDPLLTAVAVLLAEIAQADHEHADVEAEEIRSQLMANFSLSETEAIELAKAARATATESVSLHEFTRTLHDSMDYKEKEAVVEMLWRIALADRNLDKYEDYMIGKIAELLYVYRQDVLRIKHNVVESIRTKT